MLIIKFVFISRFFLRATCFAHFGLFWVNYSILIRQKSSIVLLWLCSPPFIVFFLSNPHRVFLTHTHHTFSSFVWKN